MSTLGCVNHNREFTRNGYLKTVAQLRYETHKPLWNVYSKHLTLIRAIVNLKWPTLFPGKLWNTIEIWILTFFHWDVLDMFNNFSFYLSLQSNFHSHKLSPEDSCGCWTISGLRTSDVVRMNYFLMIFLFEIRSRSTENGYFSPAV